MVEMRLFHRDLLQSSLYYHLGEALPGRELHAQRVFETLILMADDYGRGRWIPADVRTRAFSSAPTAFAEVTLAAIDQWMSLIEREGSAYRYSIMRFEGLGVPCPSAAFRTVAYIADNTEPLFKDDHAIPNVENYFFLPKWFSYQKGQKYRRKSMIPGPSPEFLADRGLILEKNGEICPMLDKTDENQPNSTDEAKGREAKRREAKGSEGKGREEKRSEGNRPLSCEIVFDPLAVELTTWILERMPREKQDVWMRRLSDSPGNQAALRKAMLALSAAGNLRRPGAYLQRVYQDEGGQL
jgi:hypothetical protein